MKHVHKICLLDSLSLCRSHCVVPISCSGRRRKKSVPNRHRRRRNHAGQLCRRTIAKTRRTNDRRPTTHHPRRRTLERFRNHHRFQSSFPSTRLGSDERFIRPRRVLDQNGRRNAFIWSALDDEWTFHNHQRNRFTNLRPEQGLKLR